MENKEKIPDNFENAVENKDSSFSVEREIKKEVIDERDPEENSPLTGSRDAGYQNRGNRQRHDHDFLA